MMAQGKAKQNDRRPGSANQPVEPVLLGRHNQSRQTKASLRRMFWFSHVAKASCLVRPSNRLSANAVWTLKSWLLHETESRLTNVELKGGVRHRECTCHP